jgi:hypothetical protein
VTPLASSVGARTVTSTISQQLLISSKQENNCYIVVADADDD